MKCKKFSLIIVLFVIMFTVGCSGITINSNRSNTNSITVSETKHEIKEEELQGAKNVNVDINLGVGKLTLNGGADKLMKAEFIYNVPEWKPIVDYKVISGQGNLLLEQPSVKNINTSNKVQYEWNISLNNKTPMDIHSVLGVGNNSLDLRDLNIKDVDIKMGVGNMDLNLCSKYKNDITVDIKGGVGKATIYLPKDMGTCVQISNGIGKISANNFIKNGDEYVNDAYGKSEFNIKVIIENGVGDVTLKLK